MKLVFSSNGEAFDLRIGGKLLFRHSADCPAVVIAKGNSKIEMHRGNFRFSDKPLSRISGGSHILKNNQIILSSGGSEIARLSIVENALSIETLDPSYDRIWVRFHAEDGETIWGGGEQMSYLSLNGRSFPMWTSEPGVGRDKSTELTRIMDEEAMAGGDYWHTNYPQPTFLTSRWLAIHCAETCYSMLDFSDPAFHQVEVWKNKAQFEFYNADNPRDLVSQLSEKFGRQPPLPDWAIKGAIIGMKSGESSFDRLEAFIGAGAAISGLWCEDWAGIRQTSFGRRLFWDWHVGARSNERFPELDQKIADLAARDIRFLAYVNPYLAIDGVLYSEAQAGGHFCLKLDSDEPHLVDFGEFDCGVLDFTRKETCEWFAERIIGREMLDRGIAGWMADFGEYLPTDLRLADGSDPMEAHNLYPVQWAKVNAMAVESRGKTGDILFFMRAGFSGVQAHCPLLWAGDQSVDFSRHDGIGTVVTAALSAGLVGNAYSHSDCGGYTSLHGNIRSEELMQRWCELAAFAPVMRSHEGNRPDDNLQYDSTPALLDCFARWSRIHAHLAPYVRELCEEAARDGMPLQRPLFLEYPEDTENYTIQDQYLYGSDLLVAPVIHEGAEERDVILPGKAFWRHCWSGEEFGPGKHRISAPIGNPAVFYRCESGYADLFSELKELAQ